MKHSHRLCAVFGVLTILLVVLGAGAWALIPAAGCAAICTPVVWGMVRGTHQHAKQA